MHPRLSLIFVALILLCIGDLRAEWITLQVPLGRAGHSFSLWEIDEATPTEAGINLDFPGQNSDGASYVKTPADVVEFVGGSFGANGTWVPDAQSYLTIQVQRKRPGSQFWLKDNTAEQFGARSQTGLINAYWRDPQALSQVPLWFFSLPESKYNNSFGLFSPSSGALMLVSKGSIQGEFSNNGQSFTSYGFFEAWSSACQGSTQGLQFVDLTENLMYSNPGFNLTDTTGWEPFVGMLPGHSVTVILPSEEVYSLYVEYGGPTALYPAWTECYIPGQMSSMAWAATAYVGQYCRFSIERDRDHFRVDYGFVMGEQDQVLDLRSDFPIPQTHEPEWTWLSFQMSDEHDINSIRVRYQDGTSSNLDSSAYTPYAYYWDAYGNEGAIGIYQVYAYVDVGQQWWLEENGVNIGTGPDFFSGMQWPAVWNSAGPDGSLTLTFPAARLGHGLWLQDSGRWKFNAPDYPTGTIGGNFGPNGEWVSWDVFTATTASGNTFSETSIYDDVSGDMLWKVPWGFHKDPAFWLPTFPLILKISATRWGHDLRIRTGSGSEYLVWGDKVQGDWSVDANGKAWFNSYGFFGARGEAEVGISWWLVDYSRMGATGPEVLSSSGDPLNFINSTDSLDSDHDGWPDWYERFVGTDPNDRDTDDDGIDDPADPNPRAKSANSPTSTLKVWTPLR